MPGLAGLVLAAGASSRMGRSKMLAEIRGEAMVRLICRAAARVCGAGVVIVVGRQADEVTTAVDGLADSVVTNPEWELGMSTSIRHGIGQLDADISGVLILPGDLAEVDEEDLTRLATAWYRRPEQPAASRFDGVLGAPAIFPRSWFARLSALQGDAGARDLLRSAPAISAVTMDAAGRDVDSPEDLGRVSDQGP